MAYPAHYAWLVDFDGPNVTSGTSVYISTSRSIKVNKSGIVCRVYHQTSLQALLFTLVHQGPSKYPVHYAWLVDFHGPWCTNVNTSAWSDAWWYTLHTMPDLLTLMDLDVLSVQGIPSNVTSGTCVYICTSRSIKVNKSGIVCRVYHQTSLQALVFTLVHQSPSKSTSQA
jgi:hypothetical protein